MISIQEAGAKALAASWNACVPSRYLIGSDLVEQNLLDHPLLHLAASGWSNGSFVAVKRSAYDIYEGPEPRTAHLSLLSFTDPITVKSLLNHAIRVLRSEKIMTLVIGMDSGHFLPGAPTDVPWMGELLRGAGFERSGLAFDLERELGSIQPFQTVEGYDARTAVESDLPALEQFFSLEFSGRWRHDVLQKIEIEGPETVFSLFRGNECCGFALLQTDGCRYPKGGAVWKADLGPNWGALGPIGLLKDARGRGVGSAFLHQALLELKRRGVNRTIIDWTTLVDYYGRQGFAITRAYRAYSLDLTDPRNA